MLPSRWVDMIMINLVPLVFQRCCSLTHSHWIFGRISEMHIELVFTQSEGLAAFWWLILKTRKERLGIKSYHIPTMQNLCNTFLTVYPLSSYCTISEEDQRELESKNLWFLWEIFVPAYVVMSACVHLCRKYLFLAYRKKPHMFQVHYHSFVLCSCAVKDTMW